jgi:hypothetical protein
MLREQLESVAASVPRWLMAAGGIGGVLISLGELVSLKGALAEGRTGFDLGWPAFGIAFGVALAIYFGYLWELKKRLERERR